MAKPTRQEVAAKWLMWAADNRTILQVMAADQIAFMEVIEQMLHELDAATAKKGKKRHA